jgi:O-antigen/teichoic acid export membrane protein
LESFLILGVFFGQAIFPRLSSQEKSHHKARKTLVWGMEMLLIFSLPIIWGTILFAPQIIELISSYEYLSHAGFLGADTILKLLVITVFFAYFNQLFTFTLVSQEKQSFLFFVNGIALIFNAGLNILFLSQYGIIAAAISTIACELLVFGFLFQKIWKHFHFPFDKENLGIIGIVNISIFSLIYLTSLRGNFILSVVLGACLYCGVLLIFRNRFLPRQ